MTAAFLHYGIFHLGDQHVLALLRGHAARAADRPLALRAPLSRLGNRRLGGRDPLEPERRSRVGASGAIFGILGGLFVLERRGNISTGGQIAGLIVLNLIITFALSSYISVGAHVGGLIAGVLLMLLLHQYRRSAAMSVAAALAVVVISVAVAYSKTRGYS